MLLTARCRAAEEAAKYNKVNIAATGKPGKFTGPDASTCLAKVKRHAAETPSNRHPGSEHLEPDAQRCLRAHLRQRDHWRRRVQGTPDACRRNLVLCSRLLASATV